MICPRCGVSNNESDQYCQSCGRSLPQAEPVLIEGSAQPVVQSELEPFWQRWNRLAIISLALSCFAWLVAMAYLFRILTDGTLALIAFIAIIVSIVCGHVAVYQCGYSDKVSLRIATAGLFLAYGFCLYCIGTLFLILKSLANWQ
jgi:hypothetical protein